MNSSSRKMSRRDWFRLKTPTESLLGNETPHHEPTVLQPLETPPNHDGMDLAELPPMREANLSPDQLALLFGDIQQLGTDIQLFQRARANEKTQSDPVASLAKAKESLLNGATKRVQIRYRWNGSPWIDTLENQSESFRLLRISHTNL